jgi:hypothetical protein
MTQRMPGQIPGDPQAKDGLRCSICQVVYEARHGSRATIVDRDHAGLTDCVRSLAGEVAALKNAAKRP